MSDNALVSVVIQAYNAEKTIRDCLESVLAQDWSDLQVVVVDDGSRDNTLALLHQMAARDPRVEVVRQENQGVSEARNTALRRCRGEYVRFVDSDDWLPPDSIRKMVEKAQATGCDLVIAGYNEVIGPMRTRRNLEDREDTLDIAEVMDRLNRYANSFFYGVLWNKLFRRSLIESQRVSFVPWFRWGEDFTFVMDFLHEAKRVSYMKDVVYHYNRRVGGLTIRQFFNCITHPLFNIKVKCLMYEHLKQLCVHLGLYGKYRRTLWLYLFRFALNQ